MFGPGARIRLAETVSVMIGNTEIPDCPDYISGNGFGKSEAEAITLTLPNPSAKYQYRANVSLDLVCNATSGGGTVVLYLDQSIDDGKTYQNIVSNSHQIGTGYDYQSPGGDGIEGRQAQLWMPLLRGAQFGLDDRKPSPSLTIRGRAQLIRGNQGSVRVDSNQREEGRGQGDCNEPVSGLIGTIHYELEECF
jgi:hypothetical protein